MKCFEFTTKEMPGYHVQAYLQTDIGEEVDQRGALPGVIICPGGGYDMVSVREAEPVAKMYLAAGYHAFVLYYSVKKAAREFRPLLELASAMAHIRENAKEWNVDRGKIAVCGFSAGGHLAASLGTMYRDGAFQAAQKKLHAEFSAEEIRPDAMILGYPVITADEYANVGSITTVSGADPGSELYRQFGLDQYVDGSTPPAFLWHTSTDVCVPVENSLKFAAAMAAAKVPFELHVFPTGDHGMSVCTAEVATADSYNGRWVEWSIRWLNRTFSFQN
ncbi:MAG: alpha/beta hydrolase [Lachnospiraceae bacterium]|nr:alpha/beta hydrolase [Lachnospiraceae bacterium]